MCKFEDWPTAPSAIDLILAAQSFEYVSPDSPSVRNAKALRILKPGGILAIFGNEPTRGTSRADDLIHQAYIIVGAPDVEEGWQPTPLEAGEFVCIPDRRFKWSVSYTADDYLGTHED